MPSSRHDVKILPEELDTWIQEALSGLPTPFASLSMPPDISLAMMCRTDLSKSRSALSTRQICDSRYCNLLGQAWRAALIAKNEHDGSDEDHGEGEQLTHRK